MATTNTNHTTERGVVEQVDPTAIVLDTNVRTDARLDQAFVTSIRDHGVMQPVVGYRAEDGSIHVLQGQRRTLAAIEAHRETIPVYLAATPGEAQRIIGQILENDQRAAFTEAERAAGYEQLFLLGLSANQIARKVHTPKAAVQSALTARGTTTGRASLDNGLTIEQAATIAELGTDEDTITRLTEAATQGTFEHTAQRIRRDQEATATIEATTADLTGRGVTVLDEAPWGYYYDGKGEAAPLDALGLEEAEHATCPGHAALVTVSWEGEASTRYLCTAWKAHGHTNTAATGSAGPMTEDEKAQRRTIVENNKAWRAATDVRRQWAQAFTQRKTAPKDATAFLAATLSGHQTAVENGMRDAKGTTSELLGTGWHTPPAATPRALVHSTSIVLAGFESTYADVHTWRNTNPSTLLYLTTITRWGYTPSEIEQHLIDQDTETTPGE